MKSYLGSGTVLHSLQVSRQKKQGIRKPVSLLFLALLLVLFCIDTSLAHDNPHSDESITTTARDVDNSANPEEREKNLRNFVEHASLHLSKAKSFTEALHLLNDFRVHRDWFYGSTYLVLLTKRGGVYIHPEGRELEDQDWSEELTGCEDGKSWSGVVREKMGCVKYVGQPEDIPNGYAVVADGPFVPFGNPSAEAAEFVLVGGLDYTPEPVSYTSFEELEDDLIAGFLEDVSGSITDEQSEIVRSGFRRAITPLIDAGDVSTQDNLRTFLTGALNFITASFNLEVFDPVVLRRIFRFDGGPWRNGSTYIYIMDINGNVVFNGANRNIEQTDLWNFEGEGETPQQRLFIQGIIDAAKKDGGGFIEYDWDDPNIEGDEPDEAGAAGGTSSKLGYAVLHGGQPGDDSRTYVFGTGLYLKAPVEDDGGDGGCSLAGADSAGASVPANSLLILLLLFFAISVESRHIERE